MQKNELANIFDGFLQKKVLIVGDVMIDAYIWGKVDRISPEAPVPVVSVTRRENLMGGAANVALNIKALGAVPLLCSVAGQDAKGREFMELLHHEGIPDQGIVISQNRITTTKFRVIGNNAQLLRVDEESEHDLDSHEANALLQKINQCIKQHKVDVMLLQDYDKGVLCAEMIDSLIEIAKQNNIPVVVDPKKKNFERYRGVKLFKPNLKELREGMKSKCLSESNEQLHQAIEHLQEKQELEMVMVTLSEKGMVLRYKNKDFFKIHYEPAHLRRISDVSGAGDTVISVAALCVASAVDPPLMCFLANLAGGIVCEYAGVVPINGERLMKEALALAKNNF